MFRSSFCRSLLPQSLSEPYDTSCIGRVNSEIRLVYTSYIVYTLIYVHQSRSQNDSGDLRGVAGGDGKLECLCGKAGTSHLCDSSTHSSGCVVNGSNAMAAFLLIYICVTGRGLDAPFLS